MKRISMLLIALLPFLATVNAQVSVKKLSKAAGIEVVYQRSYKGKVGPSRVKMTVCGSRVSIENVLPKEMEKDTVSRPEDRQPVITDYFDYAESKSLRRAELPDGKVISAVTPFKTDGFKELRTEKLMGLDCKVLRTSINSNTIDVWFTTDLPFRGTPQSGVGVPDGLVLKIVRNGDQIQEAVTIEPLKKALSLFPGSWGEEMEASLFQYTLNQSGVIRVPVFDKQRISFTGKAIDSDLQADEVYQAGGGTIILKRVKLPEHIDNRLVFAEVSQYSEGDAYDRTGSVFMIPEGKKQSFVDAMRDLKSVPAVRLADSDYHGIVSTADYDVPIELMRFFTAFGVRQFNHNKVPGQDWVDSVLYKTDVTAFAEQLQGEVWIGAYIGNWDAKGHRLSLTLKYYPDEQKRLNRCLPLFNTVNYLEQAGQPYPTFFLKDSLRATFTLTEDVQNAKLIYTATGHGGWGNGDEFNQKPNTIYLDGKEVITFIPWRDDCGTYRNLNPCSGNFSNGLSSSDLSRSNWCPGTVTNPEYILLGDLKAGDHTIIVKIPEGAPEGGSMSYWCISGTVVY